jgi:GNAT superfamily N-acetyltransferase
MLKGNISEDYSGTFLTLKGFPAQESAVIEREDIPYIKITCERTHVLEYIYVPERMRGHKLSYALLEVLFEYQETNKIDFMKFECISKSYWRKVLQKFPKRILLPQTVLQKTNIGIVKLPHVKDSSINIGKL